MTNGSQNFIKTGEVRELDFAPIPHDDDFVLDLHRPYIDEINYKKDGKIMRRIPDVFDTWMDSGSMPYAINHYPFENKMSPGGFLKKSKMFPADFIAEGLDQTRGWFYTLMVLNSALFGKAPYKNVVVNGLVLAEDGQKMSKRLKNYPDIHYVLDKYGADSLRYYLMSSAGVRSEPVNLGEKNVDEVYKKIISRLQNVVSFYELYRDPKALDDIENRPSSENVLDKWILARMDEVTESATKHMENYELDLACRPFFDFVDDLSTWYVRRSRDRFKNDKDLADKQSALNTTAYVLNTFSKITAPFIPFIAEMIYQDINNYKYSNSEKVFMWNLGPKTFLLMRISWMT